MNLEFFKYYEVEPLREFQGDIFPYIRKVLVSTPHSHAQGRTRRSNASSEAKPVSGVSLSMAPTFCHASGLKQQLLLNDSGVLPVSTTPKTLSSDWYLFLDPH